MFKNSSLLLITVLISFMSQDISAKKRFFSLQVKAKEDGELVETLKSSTDLPPEIYKKKGFIKMIKRYNPKLRNKKEIKKGEKIYIEMPYKTAMYYAKLARAKPSPEDDQFDYSFSYSLSRKLIVDSASDGSQAIESQQNAPVTIGLSMRKGINDRYSFFATTYLSRMNDALFSNQSQTAEQIVSVPIEAAIKAYVQRSFDNTRFQLYGGFDIERLTTFKNENDNIARLQHSFAFLTVGVAQPFNLFNFPMLVKASYARSIVNRLDLESQQPINFDTFSGNKVAALFIVSITKRIGLHSFFDWHLLSGSSDLDMKRFGTGLHFRF